jgi:signal transduction histidine kinase/ligand-binding sensor domain-containing protein
MNVQAKANVSRHLALLSALFLLVFAPPRARSVEPTTRLTQLAHRAWRTGDAGLMGTPQALTQTTDGYIWVSTENGLYRFDGMRFTKWIPLAGESLPSISLWHLLGTRDGSLYVSTDRGLTRIRDGHVYTYPGSPRWPGPFVEDRDGRLWMGISGAHNNPSALCKVGETDLTCFGKSEGFSCVRGVSNTTSSDDFIWVGSAEGICRWKPGTRPDIELVPSLSSGRGLNSITSLASTADGELWAGLKRSGQGAGLLRRTNGRWTSYTVPGIDGRIFSVSALLPEQNGTLWIGTADSGLYRIVDGRLDHFGAIDGLTDRNILSIFEDHERGIWIVTPKGIDHFRDYAVLSFTASEGSFADHANGVATDHRGSVYLGSRTLAQLSGNSLIQLRDDKGHLLEDVQFLFTDSRDDVWIGAGDRLLVKRDQRTASEVPGFPAEEGESVAYITEDHAHDIWASVENLKDQDFSLFQIRNYKVINRFEAPSVMGKQVMNALAPNAAGGIWIGGSAHGLFSFRNGRLERVFAGGFNDRVENLMEDSDRALWIVTQQGFIRYFEGRTRSLTTASGMPCDSGVNIHDDGRGFKWFYLHCGIVRLSDSDLAAWWQNPDARVHARVFDALEGARPNLSNGNPAQTPDGKIWSASDYDFQVIDPQHLPFNELAPPVKLERLIVDGNEVSLGQHLRLPVHSRQIELDYAALSFVIPERVRFRYRLDGHDSDWTEVGRRRQAFYNDLKPGPYVFQVTACNNDGVCNWQGTELAFTVPPAWFQTHSFRTLVVLLLPVILFLAYLYRLRRFAKALKHRFNERLQERTRLARDLHDTLLQTIQGSKLVADNAREHLDDPRVTGRALDRLSEWLDRASIEGRAALEALRSSSVEANDLARALHSVADDCIMGARMTVSISTVGAIREMHPIARDEVYRIAYEAISNACAHSGARDLWIELEYKRRFSLTVRDNGRGIDEDVLRSGKPGHFGLAGMRERALFMGGRFNISNSLQGGTAVSVVMPGQAVYSNPSSRLRDWLVELFQSKADAHKDGLL